MDIWYGLSTVGYSPFTKDGFTFADSYLYEYCCYQYFCAITYYLFDRNVYWYNGVEFSEALEAGTEKRKAYALSHMKRFGGLTGIFIVYSCISILIGIPKDIDIIIAVVGLNTTAISTIHIKL